MAISRPRAGPSFPPFLLALFLSPPLAADLEEAVEDDGREPEVVHVTATRTRALAHDVSAAATAVEQDQVRATGPDVLPEMLRGLPGAFFQQTTPGQGVPIIRGLKGSQVLHLVDGMRINNAFFRDAPNQYLGLVDPFSVERVELVRGASGSLYGADAMGGVVNFLTPAPGLNGTGRQSERRLYGSYDSVDHGLSFRAALHGGKNGQNFSGGVSWKELGHRETGGGVTVRPSGYRSKAANFRWAGDVGDRGRFSLSAQALEQPATPRVDELVPGFGQQQSSSEQFLYRPNRRTFLHARYEAESPASWLDTVQVNLARQVVTDDRLSQDFGDPVIVTEDNESTLDGLTLQFDRDIGDATHLTWGIEYYADTVHSARFETDEAAGVTVRVRSRFPDRSTMDSVAGYASFDRDAGDHWSLGAGLRYTHTRLRLPATPDSPAVRVSPGDFTGDLRAVYRIGPNSNLVANLGRGFRPPNIFDLGTLGNRPGNRFNVANPALRPEEVDSFDLGLKTRTGNWQSELFVFYLDYRDKIASVATGAITDTGRIVVRSENLREAELYGIEAGFRWNRGALDEFYGTLNYTRGEERTPGGATPADRVPPLNGRLGWRRHLSDRLEMDAWLQFAGEQDRLSPRDADDPRINPAGTPGWGTLNLHFAYRASETVELGLRLENLGDKAYREHGSGIDAPGLNFGIWASFIQRGQ